MNTLIVTQKVMYLLYTFFIETFALDYKCVDSMGLHWTEGETLCLEMDLSDAVKIFITTTRI